VLNYAAGFNFHIDSLQLIFRSSWRLRRLFKRTIFQRLFNANAWMQEFYEENLCYLIPCSEIRAVLSPLKSDPR
jgi:hypothetical protein